MTVVLMSAVGRVFTKMCQVSANESCQTNRQRSESENLSLNTKGSLYFPSTYRSQRDKKDSNPLLVINSQTSLRAQDLSE